MARFILNRPDDRLTLTRGRIFGTALKWLVLLILGAGLLRVACTAVYMSMGVNPMELTKFGGDPTNYMGKGSWQLLFKLLVIAPVAPRHFLLSASSRSLTISTRPSRTRRAPLIKLLLPVMR